MFGNGGRNQAGFETVCRFKTISFGRRANRVAVFFAVVFERAQKFLVFFGVLYFRESSLKSCGFDRDTI